MGLSDIGNKLVSAAVQAPRVFGALSLLTAKSGRGRSLWENIVDLDVEGMFYDGREAFAGIDANGEIQKQWLKRTWKPVIAGDLITRGIQFTRKIIKEAVS